MEQLFKHNGKRSACARWNEHLGEMKEQFKASGENQ